VHVLRGLKGQPEWGPPLIHTQRLQLRALALADAPAIFAYAKNPAISRWTMWEPHLSLSDTTEYLENYVFEHYWRQTPEPWGISRQGESEVIGTVGCLWVDASAGVMELAYALAEPYWGQGLMVEAARAAMSYCFKTYKLQRIQARCKAENLASQRVMLKLGMQFETTLKGSVKHRDRLWDVHYYSVAKSAWSD
jgi:ribosomal-protein-alanine N-acetyltransferase